MKKLLAGLLGGVALGMLFAPEKGEKLRKKLAASDDKISDFGKEMLTAGKDVSAEVQKFLESDDAKDLFAKGKSGLADLLDQGKDLSEKGKKEVAELLEKAKEVSSEVIEKTSEKIAGKKEKSGDILADIKGFFAEKK